MERYEHKKVEEKWRERWAQANVYRTTEDADKEKFYILDMFPYPSGEGLHVGHPKGYIATDIISRYKKMQGFNVLHPMGWDAFGLPAEQYALKNKVHPRIGTDKNIATFKKQLEKISLNYDWEREISTTDPKFYKWTQWTFIQMYKKGLVFQSNEPINWCPSCKTGLANEDLENGCCERCDTPIEKKKIPQWVIKITDYADRMLADIDKLDWQESIKESQRNWIGRSEGAEIDFNVKTSKQKTNVILMHGKDTNPQEKWYPWLAEKMNVEGISFEAPILPNPSDPHIDEWLEELDNLKPNENTTLIGHSRGGIAILRWLEKQSKDFKVKKVILVAANYAKINEKHTEEGTHGFYTEVGYNFEEIKKHCDDFVVLHSRDDGWVPFEHGEINAKGLDAKFLTFDDKGHFGSKLEKQEIPELLGEIVQEQNVILIHGCPSDEEKAKNPETRTYNKQWLSWIKEKLEQKNIKVDFPLMPHPWKPSYDEYKKEFEKLDINENSILIGTSCGTSFLLRWLGETKQKVKSLIMVAPWHEPELDKKHKTDFYNFNIDEEINNRVENIVIFTSDNDYEIGMKSAKLFEKKFDAKVVNIKGHGHYLENQMGTVEFPELLDNVLDSCVGVNDKSESIKVFTTRPDTLYGATYMVLAPEHELINNEKLKIKNWDEVVEYQKLAQAKTEIERTAEGKEKTGVKLEGVMAINPVSGEEIPIFIADYVLADYGTGAIMAVPAHDERDFEFAQKYQISIKCVIEPHLSVEIDEYGEDVAREKMETMRKQILEGKLCYTKNGDLINSDEFTGMNWIDAKEKITQKAGGEMTTSYKLRDWVFSRQRYWGEPMPLIHCDKCGVVTVPEEELPLILPEVESYEPTGTGESPLAAIDEWVNTKCPECGGPAKRETNTMPQWAGSSWYYLRYIDPKNNKELVDKTQEKYWSPVDFYVGGAEHATRHLIYARFWHKFLYDIGVVSYDEPFSKLQTVGLIMAEDGRKMSKRWGNVVNPDDVIDRFGSDTFRLYEMFMGPFDASVAWSMDGLVGPRKFLEKIWKMYHLEFTNGETSKELQKTLHKTIKKVGEDIEEMKYNTAISAMMVLVNQLEKEKSISADDFGKFLTILSPFAPHMTQELWNKIENKTFLIEEKWPEYENQYLIDDEIELVVQVNGKVRDKIMVTAGLSEEDAKEKALASEKVKKHIDGKEIRKVIFVQGKLISIVV